MISLPCRRRGPGLALLVVLPLVACSRAQPPTSDASVAVVTQAAAAVTSTLVPALVLRGDDPLIAYYDANAGSVSVAYAAGGSWTTELVEGGEERSVGRYLSAAADAQGRVHLAYRDDTHQNVRYAVGTPGHWRAEDPLPQGERRGEGASVALDLDGNPWIAYHNETTQALEIAYLTGGTWAFETVDDVGNTGLWPHIASDLGGRMSVVYQDATTGTVRLAQFQSAGNWEVQVIDGGTDGAVAGAWSSLAIRPGASGDLSLSFPRVVYLFEQGSTYALRYAEPASGDTWNTMAVDPGAFGGSDTCLAVDSRGRVFLTYLDNLNADLRVGKFERGRWRTWVEDAVGVTGFWTSCAIDARDRLHVAYVRQDTGTLYYRIVRDRF